MACSKLGLKPIGPVCGKVRLHTESEIKLAELGLALKDRERGVEPVPVHRYWCQACDAMHLTRVKPGQSVRPNA